MKLKIATIFIAINLVAISTYAQNAAGSDGKRSLAAAVVALQQGPEMDRMLHQLAQSTMQPVLEKWAPKLQANVPEARRPAVADKLNKDLEAYVDDNYKILKSKVDKVSQGALVNAYMDRFSEDELRKLNAFFSDPVIKKYQTVAPELGNVLVRGLVDESKSEMDARTAAFDAQARKEIGPDKATK